MKLNENRVLRLAGLITENQYAKLQEMEFATQSAFDNYKKQHDLRPDTKVTVAGKATTAGAASKNSKQSNATSVFGNDGDNTGRDRNVFDKVKDFFSSDNVRRPSDKEFSVADAHFKSNGGKNSIESIGVDKKTGNINASDGEHEVILSPAGKLLSKTSVQSKYDDMQADIDREGEKYRKRQQQIGKLKSFIGLDEHNKKIK